MKKIINPTVLKKDITRFSPLWVLYTVFMFLFLLLWWEAEADPAQFVTTAPGIMASMGVVNFLYAGMAAFLLFSDLFKSRMANMLHALPMRREGWFLTHTTAGLLFCLVPNVLGGLITAAMLGQYAYGAFAWLAVVVLEYLFFFGVGVFSVMCAGNTLGALSIYGIINFLTVLAGWLVAVFYEPVLYGIEVDLSLLSQLSPIVGLSGFNFLKINYNYFNLSATLTAVNSEEWLYLAITAAVGLVLLGLSVLIYRRRQLETAGDLISLRYASPVFLGLYTLLIGALFYIVGNAFSDSLGMAFLLIGLAIGFFTGKMLLEKQIKVFRWKNILAFGISLAVFLASIGLVALDPTGITRYVPEAEDVKWVRVSPYDTTYYSMNTPSCTVAEKADVEVIIQLHELALQTRYEEKLNPVPLHLQYELKNGTTVERTYSLPESEDTVAKLQSFYSRPESVLGTKYPDDILKYLEQVEFYPHDDTLPFLYMSNGVEDYNAEEKYGGENPVIQITVDGSFANDAVARGLIEAILADCEAGNMSQWHTNSVGELLISLERGGYWENLNITVSSYSANTLAYLRSLNGQ